ncbi:MAG: hypothetical protein R3344_03635 [Acidobacteriota bacterium]|nr:hypothetical protein [Acidobacteriota bacterium]
MANKRIPRIRSRFVVAVSIVLVGTAAVYVGYAGWRHYQSALDDSFRQAVLIRDIERVSMLGNVLMLLEDEERDKARQLMEFHLQYTLTHVDAASAHELAAESIAVPNLTVGVRRAREYALRHAMSGDAVQRAEKLLVALDAR